MRRAAFLGIAFAALFAAAPAFAASPKVAALQVGLRAHGLYGGSIDGVPGPLTKAGVMRLQLRNGIRPTGKVGSRTRRALGRLGQPLLGQRQLWTGLVGWDVSALEFRLVRYGLAPAAVDGRFDVGTREALIRFQRSLGLEPDGVAGTKTFRALAHVPIRPLHAKPRPLPLHVVRPGESFFSIAARFHLSPWQLAKVNNLRLTGVIVPGQRLRLPAGATRVARVRSPASRDSVRASLDHWARVYGVDPQLARALAWMESGFQEDVVSNVGAVGVMQLLPETWAWVDVVLLGRRTPRTADGNVQAGVRYLRWQLDQFHGDVKLALAGWYQGARAVREIGLYDDTKQFVTIVQALHGKV
jgi:peptidoglycan hydrolase-like protein with peptidoglycan-binding domain